MASHNISTKEFKENRDKVYVVIAFDTKTLRREGTIGNISIIRVMKEVLQYQKRNCFCLIFEYISGSKLDKMVSFNYSDYMQFMGKQ